MDKEYIKKLKKAGVVVVDQTKKRFHLFAVLQIIFVVAKIFDKLDWNWFLVFWPIWIAPAIVLAAFVGLLILVVLLLLGAFLLDCYSDFRSWLRLRKRQKVFKASKNLKDSLK